MTYQELKKLVESKGYTYFDSGEYNLNFVWIRKDMIADNHFTDDLHIGYKVKGVEQVTSVKCTTVPGLKKSLLNPVTVEGITGTAIIVPEQYRGTWEFRDTTSEFSNYPYFRQIKPVDYWRDGNRDTILDKVNEQDDRIFGTHWHKMSNVGDKRRVEDFEVNNFSLGCMGCPVSEWDKVITLTRLAIKAGQSTKFTGTII